MNLKDDSLESRVATLWAIEQIKLLKSRYFQSVDEKDWDTLATLFTVDAVVDFSVDFDEEAQHQHFAGHEEGPEGKADADSWRVVGGAEAGRVIATSVQDMVTVHQGHDPQIVVTGPSTARGRWTLYDRIEFPQETMHGYGHYFEEYELHDGKWLIASLRLTRLRVAWTRIRPEAGLQVVPPQG